MSRDERWLLNNNESIIDTSDEAIAALQLFDPEAAGDWILQMPLRLTRVNAPSRDIDRPEYGTLVQVYEIEYLISADGC